MASEARLILKALSPRIMAKALAMLDKSTAVVVSACWLAALATLILAMFAVHGAVSIKRQATDAAASEPVVPVSSTSAIGPVEGRATLDRLQHQFPDLKIEMDNTQGFTFKADNGAKFHQFITAISYIDAMEPQDHWSLREFCVGKCGQDIMRAVVVGQKVAFALPSAK